MTIGKLTLSQDHRFPYNYIVCDDDEEILNVRLYAWATGDTQEKANARPENAKFHALMKLIVAAPELLAACKHLCKYGAIAADESIEMSHVAVKAAEGV